MTSPPTDPRGVSPHRRDRCRCAVLRCALLLVAVALTSCASVTLAPRYAGIDEAPPAGTQFGGRATVRAKEMHAEAALGAIILRGSGLFESVSESRSPASDSEMAFVVERLHQNATAIPMATVFTCFVIPTYGVDAIGMRFRVVNPPHLRGTCITVRHRRAWGLGAIYALKAVDSEWGPNGDLEWVRLGHQFRQLVDEATARGGLGGRR